MGEPSRSEKPRTTEVGYGSPPERTRFKKGQSGNPRGRPKGTLNLATVLERTLREKVVIHENGTKLQAAIMQLTNKAASGELKAFQLLAALVRSAEERESQAAAPDPGPNELDEKVFLGILNRLETMDSGEDHNETNKH
jgi:hypothetical protein